MAKVDMSIALNAPADAVWSVIRGFDAMPRWHPAIARSEEVREAGKTLRKLTLQGGAELVEELERHDDGQRRYSYRITQGPLPLSGYRAEISVRDEGPGRCTVHWASTYEPNAGAESDAAATIRGVYEAGFESLKKLFGG